MLKQLQELLEQAPTSCSEQAAPVDLAPRLRRAIPGCVCLQRSVHSARGKQPPEEIKSSARGDRKIRDFLPHHNFLGEADDRARPLQ